VGCSRLLGVVCGRESNGADAPVLLWARSRLRARSPPAGAGSLAQGGTGAGMEASAARC